MAAAQEKGTFSPVEEHEEITDDYEESVWNNGCHCFPVFTSKWHRVSNDVGSGQNNLAHQNGEHRETWLARKLKEIKEFSELVAGPKWKDFIRKIGNSRKKQKNRFQYDPHSYALNFDDGGTVLDGEEAGLLLDSSRVSAPNLADERRRFSS